MIDIANGCAKRTYKSDFWRNRCVNHHYFLICTQGKSEGLGIGECYTSAIHEAAEYIIIGGKNKNLSDFANEESEGICCFMSVLPVYLRFVVTRPTVCRVYSSITCWSVRRSACLTHSTQRLQHTKTSSKPIPIERGTHEEWP